MPALPLTTGANSKIMITDNFLIIFSGQGEIKNGQYHRTKNYPPAFGQR